MRREHLKYLCCPTCRGDLLVAEANDERRKAVLEGTLQCAACAQKFPITNGIPNFVPETDRTDVQRTTSGFARSWTRYSRTIMDYPDLNDDLFRDWTLPLQPDQFEGKVIMDAGCGMGRWLRVMSSYQPEVVIGLDYSEIVQTAKRNNFYDARVLVIRGDINRLPVKQVVDYVVSIGVIHHMPDPKAGFAALYEVLKPGGEVSAWVYGKENNEWIEKFVNPVRERITSRIPDRALALMSRALTRQLVWMAKGYDALEGRPALPMGAYLRHLTKYPADYLEHIVYDHLVPDIAYYLPKEEVDSWERPEMEEFSVTARNENSWRVWAKKPSGDASATVKNR